MTTEPQPARRELAVLMDEAERRLEAAGLPRDDARRDAGVLARWLLGWDQAAWLTRRREAAPADFASRFERLVDRRATGEPVAYLTGEREFYGRTFLVTPDVLIPRPETELIVEEAGTRHQASGTESGAPRSAGTRHQASGTESGAPRTAILDVGTGSGCLAVTLALEWPSARVVATDVSPAALRVARENAARLGAGDRVEFVQTSLLPDTAAPFDLIVANPPYVPDADRTSLSRDVVQFEPHVALFGGPDGLDVIRALVPRAARALRPGGWLILEIGHGQAEAVRQIVSSAGLLVDRIRPDLQGIPRVVVARRERAGPVA